jgi:hypothetical protein
MVLVRFDGDEGASFNHAGERSGGAWDGGGRRTRVPATSGVRGWWVGAWESCLVFGTRRGRTGLEKIRESTGVSIYDRNSYMYLLVLEGIGYLSFYI